MKTIRTYILALTTAAAIFTAGCANPFITPKERPQAGEGAGNVLINLGGTKAARTLLPSIVPAEFYYVFEFTPKAGNDAEALTEYVNRSSTASFDLAAGDWTLDVAGYIDDAHAQAGDDPGVTGSADFTVTDKGQADVDVPLTAADMSDPDSMGEFVYTVSFPANVSTAELKLIDLKVAGERSVNLLTGAAVSDDGTTKTAAGVVPNVLVGFYRMVLDLSIPIDGQPSRTLRSRVVRIHKSLQTKTTELFTEEDFFKGRKFDTLPELKTYLDGLPQNDPYTPYSVGLSAAVDITTAAFIQALYPALTRYAALDLSECTGSRIGPTASYTADSTNAPNLVSVTLPSTLTTIGYAAFSGCSNLTAIDFTAITSLYAYAFQNSGLAGDIVFTGLFASISGTVAPLVFAGTNITSIQFTGNVTAIPSSTFLNCKKLTTVTLPANRTSFTFVYQAFSGCESLDTLNWDALNTNSTIVENSAFHGTAFSSLPSFNKFKTSGGLPIFSTALFSNMPNLTTVDMSGWPGTTSLSRVFSGCANLASVTLPPNVTTILYFSIGCPKIRYELGSNTAFTVSSDKVMLFKGTQLVAAHGATGDVTIPGTVTSFVENALAGAPLTKVDMSACTGLTTIAMNSFQYCTALEEVVFSAATKTISNEVFDGCTALEEITLPSALTSVQGRAFRGCTGIKVITLPSTLTSLTGDAFNTIASPELVIKIPQNLTYTLTYNNFPPQAVYAILPAGTGTYEVFENGKLLVRNKELVVASTAFSGPLVLDASITSFAQYAFRNHTGITSVDMSACTGLTGIASYAFDGAALTAVTFPASLTSLGTYAFQNTGLSSVDLSACTGLTGIGNYAFYNTTALTSVTFPPNLTSIGNYVFTGAAALTTVTFPPKLTSIGTNAFQNAAALSSVTLPATLTTIGSYAFDGAVSLRSVNFPASLTSLGNYAFQNTGLSSADLSAYTGTIGSYAFNGCTALASVSLSPSGGSIGSAAFRGTAIRTITIGEKATSIGANAFENCANLEWVKWPTSGANAYVGSNAFRNAVKLSRVELPDVMQSATTTSSYGIGASAFAGTNLRVLILNSAFTGLPADYAVPGTSYAFPATDFTIYVPNNRVNSYKTANYWSSNAALADRIKSVNTLPPADDPGNWL
jgi:hypothetical protein